jgi:16S rRNA A1518/A1519 N6-dimethyltransferase RsmA/KsgA/DIM1 with predicted DNA glycosylase/AP lyase activity
LWWLVNFKNDVNFFRTVSANSFNPIPKVNSCLIEIIKVKTKNLDINFDKFVELLNLFSPYSRKTLGKIKTLLEKK